MISKAVLLTEPAQSAVAPAQESFSLAPVANKPLICHALEDLAAIGVQDVCLVGSPAGIEATNRALADATLGDLTVLNVTADPDANLVTILHLAGRFVGDEPFVLHFGDSLCRSGLGVIAASLAQATPDVLMLVEAGDPQEDGNVIPLSSAGGQLAPAGVAVIGKAALGVARKLDPKGGWGQELDDIVAAVSDSGGTVGIAPVEGWWRHRGQRTAVLEANRFALEGLHMSRFTRAAGSHNVDGPATIHPSAVLEDATIRGPVVIGPRTRVIGSYIGPYTALGADVLIEGAEVENSVVLDGARVCHLGCRLEGSVVGKGARIARDMRLPKALRLNLPEGADISLA